MSFQEVRDSEDMGSSRDSAGALQESRAASQITGKNNPGHLAADLREDSVGLVGSRHLGSVSHINKLSSPSSLPDGFDELNMGKNHEKKKFWDMETLFTALNSSIREQIFELKGDIKRVEEQGRVQMAVFEEELGKLRQPQAEQGQGQVVGETVEEEIDQGKKLVEETMDEEVDQGRYLVEEIVDIKEIDEERNLVDETGEEEINQDSKFVSETLEEEKKDHDEEKVLDAIKTVPSDDKVVILENQMERPDDKVDSCQENNYMVITSGQIQGKEEMERVQAVKKYKILIFVYGTNFCTDHWPPSIIKSFVNTANEKIKRWLSITSQLKKSK